MSYKILEKNGVDNENIDGGAFNNFTAGNRDGVIGGVLSECSLSSVGNAVSIGTGVLMIHGIRVKITSMESVYVSSVPVVPTRYQIIAQITLTDKLPEFFLFVQEPKNLTQQEFYENDNGVYEVEIGRFTHNPDGSISDLTRTVDTLYGAAASGSINVGNITVREIDAGNPPEVDIDKRMEDGKEYLDFDFGMPKATSTDAEAVHFTAQDLSESQKQQVRKNIGSDDVYASKSGKFKDMGVGSLLIEDTRDTNPLASEFSQIEKTEFKTGQAIGLPANVVQDSGFYSLKTIKGWTEGNYYAYQQAVDASNGGNVVSAGRVFYRYGNGEKWNAWREFLTAPIDYNSYDFTNVIVGKTVSIEAEKQPKVNTLYINCAISGSVGNEIDITLTFVNCTGTFLNNSNTIKIYVYSSPKLTVTGRGAENWRNIFIDGIAECTASNTFTKATNKTTKGATLATSGVVPQKGDIVIIQGLYGIELESFFSFSFQHEVTQADISQGSIGLILYFSTHYNTNEAPTMPTRYAFEINIADGKLLHYTIDQKVSNATAVPTLDIKTYKYRRYANVR